MAALPRAPPATPAVDGLLGASGAALLLAPVPAAFWLNGHDVLTLSFAAWAAPAALLVIMAAVLALRPAG